MTRLICAVPGDVILIPILALAESCHQRSLTNHHLYMLQILYLSSVTDLIKCYICFMANIHVCFNCFVYNPVARDSVVLLTTQQCIEKSFLVGQLSKEKNKKTNNLIFLDCSRSQQNSLVGKRSSCWTLSHLSAHMVNCLLHENRRAIPIFLMVKNLWKMYPSRF